ncbi:MAG: hypothetical protein ACRDRA_17945 [Pseudonocardiaceae bacterium]
MQPHDTLPKRRIWTVTLISLGTLAILALLFIGPQGSHIAGVLSLLLAFLSVGLTIAGAPARSTNYSPINPDGNIFPQSALDKMPKRVKLLISIFFAFLVTGILALGLFLLRGPAVQLADQAKVKGGDEMFNGSEAIVLFAEKIPDLNNLDLTPHLENTIGTGDCYQSATMTLKPAVNGAPKPPISVKGREGRATISIGREVRDLVISVKLRVDEGCRMSLSVTNAKFYD